MIRLVAEVKAPCDFPVSVNDPLPFLNSRKLVMYLCLQAEKLHLIVFVFKLHVIDSLEFHMFFVYNKEFI